VYDNWDTYDGNQDLTILSLESQMKNKETNKNIDLLADMVEDIKEHAIVFGEKIDRAKPKEELLSDAIRHLTSETKDYTYRVRRATA